MLFSVICAFMLLVAVVPETEAIKELVELMDDKKLKKKVMKRLIYYFMIAGNRKIYTVPFPLPLPIPWVHSFLWEASQFTLKHPISWMYFIPQQNLEEIAANHLQRTTTSASPSALWSSRSILPSTGIRKPRWILNKIEWIIEWTNRISIDSLSLDKAWLSGEPNNMQHQPNTSRSSISSRIFYSCIH